MFPEDVKAVMIFGSQRMGLALLVVLCKLLPPFEKASLQSCTLKTASKVQKQCVVEYQAAMTHPFPVPLIHSRKPPRGIFSKQDPLRKCLCPSIFDKKATPFSLKLSIVSWWPIKRCVSTWLEQRAWPLLTKSVPDEKKNRTEAPFTKLIRNHFVQNLTGSNVRPRRKSRQL